MDQPQLKDLQLSELNPPLKVTRITGTEGLTLLKDFFARTKAAGGVVGFDIETTPLKDFFYRRIRTLQFGNTTEQYVIDLRAFCLPDNWMLTNDPAKIAAETLFDAQGNYGANLTKGLKEVIDVIEPVVCTDEFLKVGVSLGFEYMTFYWNLGLRTYHFWDCALVEKCIWAGAHSMKDYGFYSMEEMMERYFQLHIDKQYQESFTLDADLIDEQINYAALDTRFPIAIMSVQKLILKGATYKSLSAANNKAAVRLKHINPLVTGDNLEEIAQIENDAIGAFQDMHVHGEKLDRPRWLGRVNKSKVSLAQLIAEELDPIFIPIVGKKTEIITDEQIEEAKDTWKFYNTITPEEIELKSKIRSAKKQGLTELVQQYEADAKLLEEGRKAKKEALKEVASTLGKTRTKIKNLAAKCEGEALINYGSDAQLLKVIQEMKGLKKITNLDDETLEKYEHFPVMSAIRKYHGYQKEIGTYGDQWATEWMTKPCKEEGWLHPGDGRLHCVFNQYDAETGRSSSEKPNGQNLPQDKEVRECFIADAPDESIRISTCCDADTLAVPDIDSSYIEYICTACDNKCQTKAEEYVIVTADMSGAELRIIAEEADDPVWIEAFARGEDVHSVGTELLYPEEWPAKAFNGELLKNKKTGKMEPYWCEYYKLHTEETVKRNPKATVGHPMRQKCECPAHKEMRDENKATNFLLAYGGGPSTLAKRIKKALEKAVELMGLHERKFPRIWAYLDKSGRMAKTIKRSFDMFGRRRLFPEPTNERAKERFIQDKSDRLERKPEEVAKLISIFETQKGRKPTKEELWDIEHRQPTQKEIASAYVGLSEGIGRQGKNHSIQGTNASIAKLAMGAGRDKDGKPYLWHTLPQYKAKLLKFVHDELVVQCPKRYAEKVADLIGDAFKRAAATKMKKVVMEFDYNIASYWKK